MRFEAEPLSTRLDIRSDIYRANREAMEHALHEVDECVKLMLQGGGERYVSRHRERGRLLARERVELLVDQGSALLELSPLAGWGTDDPLGGGVVSAVGVVAGVECVIVANEPTVRGGSMSPSTVRKILRSLEVARNNRLPLINLTESGGADLPRQAEIFVPGGAIFREISRLSAASIPTIALVFGSSTAGGAYIPGLSDYTVLVERQAQVYLGGPPLVKMAIDEDADEESLGGAEMHARTSGVADYLARNELDALRIGRRIMSSLNWRKEGTGPSLPSDPPAHDPDELLGVAAADPRVPYEIREVIARIVDGSRFAEFKPLYGSNLVTGWASIHGYPVGILANNGVLFSEESQKGAHFIQLCNQTDTPLVFMQNITGFMVGTQYEQGGIIKDGAKLINAVSNSTVPHLTLMVGASYGAGNYGMAGRAFQPRFVFTWPSHRIAVMGGRQLAGVLSIIRNQAAQRLGREIDAEADALLREETEAQIERESAALFATGHQWDDGIVDPRDSRTVLGVALSAAHSAPVRGSTGYAVYRM